MDYQAIELTTADGLAVITLNRPDVMNALDTQMRAEITHAIANIINANAQKGNGKKSTVQDSSALRTKTYTTSTMLLTIN